jgi:hypothetical protein
MSARALTDGKEVEERSHPYEDSCGISSHMNEDDEKLNTSITEEEDHRSVLVIGGIKIFFEDVRERVAYVLRMQQQKDNKLRM